MVNSISGNSLGGGGATLLCKLERSSRLLPSLCILAALLLTACDGTGEISRTDEPAYGGSGSSSSSGSSGLGGSYTANFSFDEFMRLTDAGDTEALTRMFRDDSVSSGSGGGAEGGEYGEDELVMSADDLGVPDGGTVTLSIEGGDEDYEETATADDDGNVFFFVPRQRVGSTITVSLVVKKENGTVAFSGKKTLVVKAGCQFGITLNRNILEDFVFVAGNGTVGDLYVCIHEVTQGEYEKYCSYNGGASRQPSDEKGKGPDYPAYYVSFYDVLVYCNLRSMAEGLTPCYSIGGSTDPAAWGAIPTSSDATWNAVTYNSSADGYRLPTHSEWKPAADDGHTYSGSDNIRAVAWYYSNSGDDGGSTNGKSHPVMTKAPNAKGIYDMSGNVQELLWLGSPSSYGASCGGSWSSRYISYMDECSVSYFSTTTPVPTSRSDTTGFRVVRNAN